jgi:hypothetical protein
MKISNGTRQGAILSPIFWSVYADPLLQRFCALGLGAHIGGLFMGAVCYAEDVLLIAPTGSAMQKMFKFSAAPAEVVNALKVYNSSFYGSSLWDLAGEKATGTLQSSWPGAALSRHGHTSFRKCSAVVSTLPGLIF